MGILVSLGLLLLFFPPIFTALFQDYFKRFPILVNYIYNLLIGAALTGMMIFLVPQATYVFIFYYLLFFSLRAFIRGMSKGAITQLDAFSLSVYICFAVSVLWEIPIQLTIYQNIDAVILSLIKYIAIPLFFLQIYKMGWRPGIELYFTSIFLVTTGIMVTVFIYVLGIDHVFWMAHAFRLPIIIYLLYLIPYNITHIKETTKDKLLKRGEINE